MDNEHSDFRYNACSITAKVAGIKKDGSGFLYITPPMCGYNYIITARHIFQEGSAMPVFDKMGDVTICRYVNANTLEPLVIPQKELRNRLLFVTKPNLDWAVIRVEKEWLPKAKRIFVKNIGEVKSETPLQCFSFPAMSRDERVPFNFKVTDNDLFNVKFCENIKEVEHIKAISGSGIYLREAPYLVGIVSMYRFPDMELNQLQISKVSWEEVNYELESKGWVKLETGESKYTKITENKEIINIGDIEINGLSLDLSTGIDNLQHDLKDDWFFDPLHYVDMCNKDFVLEYFSRAERRLNYKTEKMSIAYIPKKSLVLRKAMLGSFTDRLIYTSVMGVLGPVIEQALSNFVFSARYNGNLNSPGLIVNGVEQWKKMNYLVKDWLEEKKGCLVKVDLLNYYDTINKDTLIRLLYEVTNTEREKNAVAFLKTFLMEMDEPESKVGLPQNCDASSLLATFYVSHVDEFMLSRVKHYCRFMDDIYFVASDIFDARKLLQMMEKELRTLGLSLNAQKVKFLELDEEEDVQDFASSLYVYDYKKQLILKLMKSQQKNRRMGAVAMIVDEIETALFDKEAHGKEQAERSLSFCLHILSSSHVSLYSYWNEFYKALLRLVKEQEHEPSFTPLICQIIAALDKSRDISEIEQQIATSLMDGHFVYEWQTYNLWMLLAFLKYQTPELIKYATEQIDSNDETRRMEVAAIMIYMVTIRPKYNRVLLHKLRGGFVHGYFQARCAVIACRTIENMAMVDKAVLKSLQQDLSLCHAYLYKHKDKDLVFFHSISSFLAESNENLLFPEFYSGL